MSYRIYPDPRKAGVDGDASPVLLVDSWNSALVMKPSGTPTTNPVPSIPGAFKRWAMGGYGPHKMVSDYWRLEHEKNPSMDHLVLTMELIFGDDKTLLVSNKPIKTTSQLSGVEYGYLGILDELPAVSFNATLSQSTSQARSFSMSIPNEYLDALDIVKSGRMLAGLAEISLQVDGGDYDERFVVMRGSMDSGVVFGNTDGEMVTVSVVDPKEILSMMLPPYKVQSSYPALGESGVEPFSFGPADSYGVDTDKRTYIRGELGSDGPRHGEGRGRLMDYWGAFSGQAYPPAAGVGKSYPIVFGYFPRVPCVPLTRSPHASSSEFGSIPDEMYKEYFGDEKMLDHTTWWVVAYGHGHRFKMAYGSAARQGEQRFLTVKEIRDDILKWEGVTRSTPSITSADEVAIYSAWSGETDAAHFSFYLNGDPMVSSHFKTDREITIEGTGVAPDITITIDSGYHETKAPWMQDGFACMLSEVADTQGVPITVLRIMPESGFDYTEKIQIPMISSIGIDVGEGEAALSESSSIINCIRYFCESFTTLGKVGIDVGLFSKAEAKIGNLIVSGIVNGSGEQSQALTIEWVEGQLLKGFPMVSMAFTGQGYGPVVIDRRSQNSGEYIVGQDMFIGRVSSIKETPKTNMFNEYTMRYNYDFEDGVYQGFITRNAGNSITCSISEDQAGRRTAPVIESLWIRDEAVAEFCIDWMCEHQTLPSYTVEYRTESWMIFRHTVGDNIKITDDRLGLSEIPATILKINYEGDSCVVQLILWVHYYSISGSAINFPLPINEGTGGSSET